MARIRLFARAREVAGVGLDHLDALTLGELLEGISVRYGEEFRTVLGRSSIWVNGEEAPNGYATLLRASDEVSILPPVSGGQGDDA